MRVKVAALTTAVLVSALPSLARGQAAPASEPPSKQACFESHAASQELRLEGSLIEARNKLKVCSDASCPAMLRTDCASWFADVEQAIPSVIFNVERDGNDVSEAKVSVDGISLTEKLDGTAFEFNPGAHRFKFEIPEFPATEQTVVLRQAEKRRAVRVEFRTPQPISPSSPTGPGPGTQPTPVHPAVDGPRPIPVLTYIFGGIALAAAGAGAYLGLDAMSQQKDREESCSPVCPTEVVDELKTQLLLADILGGVAVASGTLSAIVFFTRPVVPDERPANGSNSLRRASTPPRLGIAVTGTF
jgi:hypothetical protein